MRRLVEDPLYYYLGWTYGTRAVDWVEGAAMPGLHAAVRQGLQAAGAAGAAGASGATRGASPGLRGQARAGTPH